MLRAIAHASAVLAVCISAFIPVTSSFGSAAYVAHRVHVHHTRGCWTHRCDVRVGRIWWRKHHPREVSGWVIPWPVVNCESKGTNEARHEYSAGIDPAGYYQIISSTWKEHHGPWPYDAAKHPKRVQDRVAEDILHTGGLREWDCAVKLGYA